MNLIQPFFEFLGFLFSVILSFYFPGALISSILKLKLNFLEKIFFNTVLGLVIFALLAYFLEWLKFTSLILPILILSFLLVLIKKEIKLKFKAKDLYVIFFIILASIIFCLPMFTSGQFGSSIRLIGINQSDSLWHLSLINELQNNFPPGNPGFAGVPLKGYHFFFNMILARLTNEFGYSSLSVYYHFFPFLISFLWGLGVYSLMMKWKNDKVISYLAVFLTFFGGSFSFLLRLTGHPTASLDDAFGITQPATSLVNPPLSISIVLLIAFLFSLLNYFQSKNKLWLIPLALIAGSSVMFKIYVGIIIFSALIFISVIEILRKNFVFPLVMIGAAVITLLTYGPFSDPTSKIFFDPLWSPNRMMEANLPWFNFSEKYSTYLREGVIHRLVEIEFIALVTFIIGSLGTRVIGFIYFIPSLIRRKISISVFDLTVIWMALVSIVIPLLFIQSGKVFEMIQMTWYFLFLTSIVSSIGLYQIAKKVKFSKILIIIFLLLTLPSAYDKLSFYLLSKGETIPREYIQAAGFLKKQGNYNSTVLELPSSTTYIGINTTKEDVNSWFGGSTPKLLALSDKRGYVNNEFINFLGVDYASRLKLIVSMFRHENSSDFLQYYSVISDNLKNVSYIYSPRPLLRLEKTNIIQRVFQNSAAFIYKVNL